MLLHCHMCVTFCGVSAGHAQEEAQGGGAAHIPVQLQVSGGLNGVTLLHVFCISSMSAGHAQEEAQGGGTAHIPVQLKVRAV
jgi:hypothetical protein